MSLKIPNNATQEEFEELLRQNHNIRELYCYGCPLLTNLTNIEGLKKLYCRYCPLLTVDNIGYMPSLIDVRTDIPNFKERQEYLYKLRLIKPDISRKLGKKHASGFTDDLMRMLETY